MPLHKSSSRAPRLDPTMISAPLGDFRHTMHIGRGGDTFGDTSFLSTVGPSPSASETGGSETPPAPPVAPAADVDRADANDGSHSESVSSFTLDLDLDLGPSMLGDVLGVMDGLGMEEVFGPAGSVSPVEINQANGAMEKSVESRNELNGKKSPDVDENGVEGDSRIPDGNSFKPKGLRPKVRFSDKREEIIRQESEEEEGQGFQFPEEDECASPTTEDDGEMETDIVSEAKATEVELPASPASSHSSEGEDVTALDRRKVDVCHSETDSEDEEEVGKGYTFEDEFDDEIGL